MSKILVIGEALIDEIINTSQGTVQTLVGGSPANVAKGLARLGAEVELASWIGTDRYGKLIERELEQDRVILPPTVFQTAATSIARATIGEDGKASYEFQIDWQLPTMPQLQGVDWVHTGSIAAILEPGAEQLLQFLSCPTLPIVSFDPNIRTAVIENPKTTREKISRFIDKSAVVKMSDEDAQWLYPNYSGEQIWEKLQAAGVQIFALTKGEKGAEFWGPDGFHHAQGNYPAKLVDTVGAGDSFMAALICGIRSVLASKNGVELSTITAPEMRKIMDFCLRVAAKTVSRAGANPPSLKEIVAAADRIDSL